MPTTQIQVLDLVGPVCVDPADGTVLCQQTYAALSRVLSVLLDFKGVRILASSFLNATVGCLFANFSVDTINERLNWIGLDETDEKLMGLVLKNAHRFYTSTPEQQRAMVAGASRAIAE